MDRRVVITGLGAATPLGVGAAAMWDGLLAGRACLRPLTRFDPSGFPCRLGAEVPDLRARDSLPKSYRKAVKVMARDIELAIVAARCAVEDAGIATRGTLPEGSGDPASCPPSRMGCHIGAGLISAETDELTMALATAAREGLGGLSFDLRAWGTGEGGGGGMNNLPPLWMLKYLPNMLACHVTIIHGAEGPSNTITCAEASGLLSIGESTRVIQRDDADLCFSGGAESQINLMRFLRMDFAGRLAPTGDEQDGSRLVRPYDPAARGGLAGEAGSILILEELSHAADRGARPYAEIIGYGAAHSVPPDPANDEGLAFAIENALEDAGATADQIDAIVPHAAGIRAFDDGEAAALRRIFGPRLRDIPLVTTTPSFGDCLAANGGIAAAIGALALREQRLPARIHAGSTPTDLQAGRAESRPATLRHVLVATGAMGGQNAAVVLRAIA